MRIPIVVLLLLVAAPGLAVETCDRCHGNLEPLATEVGNLEEARRLVAPSWVVETSAHTGMACVECHVGTVSYPHPEAAQGTATCASCHQEAEAPVANSVHGDEDVACRDCHGVHDIRARVELETRPTALDAGCLGCHADQAPGFDDVHRTDAGCHDCHGAHDALALTDPAAWTSPTQQGVRCGTCHEEPAAAMPADAHGMAVASGEPSLRLFSTPADPENPAAPSCATCHGAHPMTAVDGLHFQRGMLQQCAACHSEYGARSADTYHTKAILLGSLDAASCASCHAAHGILPADDPRSWIHEANLESTCGECHENVRPAFVSYQPHPDPLDRERGPAIFFSFIFMNALFAGVVGVFVLHTLVWWVRIVIDQRHAKREARP